MDIPHMFPVAVGLLEVLGADVALVLGVGPLVVRVRVGHMGLEVGLLVKALATQFALVVLLRLANLLGVDVSDVSSFGGLGKGLFEFSLLLSTQSL